MIATVGSRAWSMGIVLAPQWRGQGWGSLAQRLLGDHLQASTHPGLGWSGERHPRC